MKATGSVLLDTTIVVDHLRGKSPVLNAHINQTTTLYLPVTALGELLYGAPTGLFSRRRPSNKLRVLSNFAQSSEPMNGPLITTGKSAQTWRGSENPFHKMIYGLQQ